MQAAHENTHAQPRCENGGATQPTTHRSGHGRRDSLATGQYSSRAHSARRPPLRAECLRARCSKERREARSGSNRTPTNPSAGRRCCAKSTATPGRIRGARRCAARRSASSASSSRWMTPSCSTVAASDRDISAGSLLGLMPPPGRRGRGRRCPGAVHAASPRPMSPARPCRTASLGTGGRPSASARRTEELPRWP